MLKYKLLLFTFLFARVPGADISIDVEGKDDRLVLNPAELIDLILKERMRTEAVRTEGNQQDINTANLIRRGDEEQIAPTKTEESTDDGETLKSRKIWSRWGKWGSCSVSCGAGVMSRRRECVAGRCARGEREEQRRACRRAPCLHFALEPHDSE